MVDCGPLNKTVRDADWFVPVAFETPTRMLAGEIPRRAERFPTKAVTLNVVTFATTPVSAPTFPLNGELEKLPVEPPAVAVVSPISDDVEVSETVPTTVLDDALEFAVEEEFPRAGRDSLSTSTNVAS